MVDVVAVVDVVDVVDVVVACSNWELSWTGSGRCWAILELC